jgi:undecaprenyl diphosphate synthase
LSEVQVSLSKPQSAKVPRHVAIIMDGNGRWAKARSLPRALGHRRGAEAVRDIVVACRDLGIGCLTLYAFSSENWKRPPSEVGDLMDLLRIFIRRELDELDRNKVRIRVIGDRGPLARDIVSLVEEAEARTARNPGLTLVIALNYGSHNEIIAACRALAREAAAGRIDPDQIDEAMFAAHLHTAGLPDPDLLIRTSGEQRLSNFLLWQSAYTELVFTNVLWPDFGRAELEEAVAEFQRRDRRFGASQ